MFHWICPECGREIPPAVRECPVCDPRVSDLQASPPPTFEHEALVPVVAVGSITYTPAVDPDPCSPPEPRDRHEVVDVLASTGDVPAGIPPEREVEPALIADPILDPVA